MFVSIEVSVAFINRGLIVGLMGFLIGFLEVTGVFFRFKSKVKWWYGTSKY